MGSAILLCGHRTCHGIEEERILASVSTIVVVAGQTQVHTVTLATVRPTIVPPIVPGPLPSTGLRAHRARQSNLPGHEPARNGRRVAGVADVFELAP